MTEEAPATQEPKNYPLRFTFWIGLGSLFAAMTYEGAQSMIGPYLNEFIVTGTIVGFIAGGAECISFLVYSFIRQYSHNTEKPWLIIFIGCLLYLLTVPALAFAPNWMVIAVLVLLNHVGRATCGSFRDILLFMLHKKGLELSSAIHAALDQIGSVFGPLIVGFLIYSKTDFQTSFLLLLIPAMISFMFLLISKGTWRKMQTKLVISEIHHSIGPLNKKGYRSFLIGVMLIGFGYADFTLITFHFIKADLVPLIFIPIIYAITMSIEAIFGLMVGMVYQKTKGIRLFVFTTVICAFAAPFLFYGGFLNILIGTFCWSIGIAAQTHLIKPCIAAVCPKEHRPWAYRNLALYLGISWFLGSICLGLFYDYYLQGLVILSVGTQLLAIPFLLYAEQQALVR